MSKNIYFLLDDVFLQVTLEEVNSQIALEYGQAMTVNVVKANSEIMRKLLIFPFLCVFWGVSFLFFS